jgi:hypothetical protein
MTKAELTAENRPAWKRSQHCSGKGNAETHENQGGIEILIMFLHEFGIVLRCLSLVHGVEIEVGVIVLDWLEVHPESLLDAW